MNDHDHAPCTEAGEHRRTQRHSKTECPESTTTEHVVRFVAEYQLFGDVEGRAWMVETLDRARTVGDIAAFEVTGSHPGPFGIQLVTFTVDVPLAEGGKWDLDYDEAKEQAEALLNEIVGDSDIDVRWASPIMTGPDEDEPKIENPCSQCGKAEADDWGMCTSCQHDALRSGWVPGKP